MHALAHRGAQTDTCPQTYVHCAALCCLVQVAPFRCLLFSLQSVGASCLEAMEPSGRGCALLEAEGLCSKDVSSLVLDFLVSE